MDLLLIQLFGNVLDRFVLGENIGLCVRFSCYLTLHHARCFARIVLHVQTFEICVGRLYYLFAIRENSGFLRYVTIAILFVFGVYLFCGQ